MQNKNTIKVVLAGAALLSFGAVQAGVTDSNSGTLNASATIAPECAVAPKTALTIAKLTMIDALTATADTTTDNTADGELYAICTSGTPTPQLRFTSANGTAAFKLTGADTTTTIDYTLYVGTGASGTAIVYNTDAPFTGFDADGTQKTLALSMKVAAAAKTGKLAQQYTDTITVTTSYTP